jgi:Zn-dependent M28 family amino/carboxypeptidase
LTEQRAAAASKNHATPVRLLDSAQIISDLLFLASDACQGRAPGSTGHQLAAQRVMERMRAAGVDSFGGSLLDRRMARPINGSSEIRNVVGWIKGTRYPSNFIVVSAHYDHLGIRNGKTFYGADDNASGTACLLAMAKYFKQHPHEYSLVFAAFDREESGLEGAEAFAKWFAAEKSTSNVLLNLNMDMIARSDKNEIFASGISHYPKLRYLVDAVQEKVNVALLMGHDTGNDLDDWTKQSDHHVFHKLGIPFLYLGVEDHPDYHKPTDTPGKINFSRYIENCNMIAMLLEAYQ